MGRGGKHVAGPPLWTTPRGKHASPLKRPPTLSRLLTVAVAFSIAVVGSLLLIRATTSPSAAGEAVTVSSEQRPAPHLQVPGIKRLVVYGHSMPAGRGASDPSKGYAVLAAKELGLKLVDRAVGGTSAANATKTMEASPPAGPHDAVVLHTGLNDIFRRGYKAVGHGRQAIRHFLEGTSDAGRRVIVLECQVPSWKWTPAGHIMQPAYKAWNAMLRQEAARWPDVRLLDTCEVWNPRQFTNAGQYHPNDAGHARLASDLAALLASS